MVIGTSQSIRMPSRISLRGEHLFAPPIIVVPAKAGTHRSAVRCTIAPASHAAARRTSLLRGDSGEWIDVAPHSAVMPAS